MLKDHIQRGDYTHHTTPKLIFSAVRISGAIVGMVLLVTWSDSFDSLADVLGNLPVLLFIACLFLAVLQQVHWVWTLARERFTWFMALFPWNTGLDILWIYVLSQALNNGVPVRLWILIGAVLCVSGLSVELTSNVQRHRFKRQPSHAGKLYTGGLFSLVIHPNYAGYLLWRSAFPLMTGYPLLAAIAFVVHFAQFIFQAHPPFMRYMRQKYGHAWVEYATGRKIIIPGLL